MALNDKQKRFCEEYVIDLNATQAAIRAGYSENTAGSIGFDLLKKPEINEFVKILQLKLSEQSSITAEMVLRELAKCGFANIQDTLEEGNSIVDISKIDRNKAAAVSGVKRTVKEFTNEHGTETTTQVEVKFHDKISALEKIGKHIGMFTDRIQLTTDGIKSISIEPINEKNKG